MSIKNNMPAIETYGIQKYCFKIIIEIFETDVISSFVSKLIANDLLTWENLHAKKLFKQDSKNQL